MTQDTQLSTHTPSCWIITDGKAGDVNQCTGVAEAMGLNFSLRRIAPRKPWVWLMPRGPIDPQEAPDKPGSPLSGPLPDIVIASGWRTIAYVRHVKRLSRGRTFTMFMKDPRTGPDTADFIWVPQHDRLRGPNVFVTLTSPHNFKHAALLAARANPPAWLNALPSPRVAVLVGGDSIHHRFKPENITEFAQALTKLAESGVGLMGSRSRRTPEALATMAGDIMKAHKGFWWDGTGPNPYIDMLANADAIVVTADSVNMIGEAAATGVPVLVYEPSGGHAKIGKFLNGLVEQGIVHRFEGQLVGERYEPLDSTVTIARTALAAYEHHRAAILADT